MDLAGEQRKGEMSKEKKSSGSIFQYRRCFERGRWERGKYQGKKESKMVINNLYMVHSP